jgi:PAT family beta-lactamase induction signal transducer AmpG
MQAFTAFRRRPMAMVALGFSAGLPTVLVSDVLSLWLRDSGTSLQAIGYFSLVGLAYALKFLWAPLLDTVEIPFLSTRLGRRRAWILACQLSLAAGLWLIALADPARQLSLIAVLVLSVALLSATQDIAIDAWRIEVAPGAGQGLMAAAYQWGYRIAVLAGGAIPLILAGPFGWNVAYSAMTALMAIGIAAAVAAPRETREDAPSAGPAAITDGFREPIRDFFRRHGSGAALILVLVCTYRLPDLVRSIRGPFYLDLGFTLVEIAEVRRVFGIVMTLAGVAAGGVAVTRFGVARSMVVGAAFATASSLDYAWLAVQGRDIPALVATTGLEHAAAGFAGTCLIAYMSGLTSPTFAATQYALLSSIFALPGRLLGSQSGLIVEDAARAAAGDLKVGYMVFFLYSTVLGLVALVLALRVARSTT